DTRPRRNLEDRGGCHCRQPGRCEFGRGGDHHAGRRPRSGGGGVRSPRRVAGARQEPGAYLDEHDHRCTFRAARGDAPFRRPTLSRGAGRPDAAAAGKLFIVAGGEVNVIARCQNVFDAVGQRTFVTGDTPAWANLVKLSGNFLIAAMIECLGEAVALMRKSGVDPQRFVDIMTSSLFAAPVYRTY